MGVFLLLIGWLIGYSVIGSPTAGIVIALIVYLIMNLVAYYQGDSILLSIAGARKIEKKDHPRLYNVVEEMKIASALPSMPAIYIIDDPALNAFATGRDITHASVAITTGLLQKLNRDELQGVIAHEISHIKNRDVLLMAMCSVLLGTIVLLSFYGSRIMLFSGGSRRSSRSSGGGGAASGIIMLIAFALMILAPIFAQLIYLAISRKREYLADASAALYTRNPEGLASALEKLSVSSTPVKKANKATAPMYIVNPFRGKKMDVNALSSTHPPIQERIRILRSIAGTVSLDAYNTAYGKVKGNGGTLIGSKTVLSSPGSASIVSGSGEGPLGDPVSEKKERTREVNDMMYRLDDYSVIDCDCGARLKIPPIMRGRSVQCPRCGRKHQPSEAKRM